MKKINYALALVAAYSVFIAMFVMTADVAARAFQIALPGAVELTEISLGLMIFLGWSYTQEQKGHIHIDLVYRRFPTAVQRILDLFHPVLGFVLMIIIVRQGYKFALYSRSSGEITENLALPLWPFKMVMVIGGGAFCLQLAVDFLRALRSLRKS